jgi:hypothetical protein
MNRPHSRGLVVQRKETGSNQAINIPHAIPALVLRDFFRPLAAQLYISLYPLYQHHGPAIHPAKGGTALQSPYIRSEPFVRLSNVKIWIGSSYARHAIKSALQEAGYFTTTDILFTSANDLIAGQLTGSCAGIL